MKKAGDDLGVVSVQGFEFSTEDSKNLTNDTVFILGCLKRKGVVHVSVDDGPMARKTIKQLQELADKEGYFIVHEDNEHSYYLFPANDPDAEVELINE